MKAYLRAFLVLVLLLAAAAAVLAYSVARRGLSTRAEPSRVEELLARGMRRLATPSATREMANPVPLTDAVRGRVGRTSPITAPSATPTTAAATRTSAADCIRPRPTCGARPRKT